MVSFHRAFVNIFMFDYLVKASNHEVKKTLSIIKEARIERQAHRLHRKGWTNDKEKSGRRSAKIPLWVLASREYSKYFDKNIPVEDRRKESDKFLKLEEVRTPWGEKISPKAFWLVDRL